MIRQKFERVGRANVMLVAAPRVAPHFLNRVLPHANLTVLDRAKSFDPIVEQVIQPSAKALGLLVCEVADVEGRILELPFELRRARLPPADFRCPSIGLNFPVSACKSELVRRLAARLIAVPASEKTLRPFVLVVGKPLGILLASALAVATRLALKPKEYSWAQLAGAAALGGIGFTMSLFIAGEAFRSEDFEAAKIAVFIASVLSAVIGVTLLVLAARSVPAMMRPLQDRGEAAR